MDHLCFCVLCFSCFRVCSLLPCDHLRERTDLLALVGNVNCIFVTFQCGILGQVWYLIVSVPDRCRPSYFVYGVTNFSISLEVNRQISHVNWQIFTYFGFLNISYP